MDDDPDFSGLGRVVAPRLILSLHSSNNSPHMSMGEHPLGTRKVGLPRLKGSCAQQVAASEPRGSNRQGALPHPTSTKVSGSGKDLALVGLVGRAFVSKISRAEQLRQTNRAATKTLKSPAPYIRLQETMDRGVRGRPSYI